MTACDSTRKNQWLCICVGPRNINHSMVCVHRKKLGSNMYLELDFFLIYAVEQLVILKLEHMCPTGEDQYK